MPPCSLHTAGTQQFTMTQPLAVVGLQLSSHQCLTQGCWWSLYSHDSHVSTCYQGLLWFNGNLWYHVLSCKVVNIGSGNGLVPDGTKPLPESVLTLHQCGCVSLTCTCMTVMSVPAVTARACFDLMETCDTVYCHAKWSTLVQVMAWHQAITWISVDLGVAVRLCGIDLMALAQVMARSQHKEVPVVQKVFDMGVRLWFSIRYF